MTAPMVPTKMSSSAGGAMIAAGLPPSMIIEPMMAPNATTRPMIVAGSISSALPATKRHDLAAGGGVQACRTDDVVHCLHAVCGRTSGVGGLRQLQGLRGDRGAPLAGAGHELAEALGDDELVPVHHRDDGVGRGLGTLDQVRVD